MEKLIIPGVVFAFFIAMAVWSTIMQRKGIASQKIALDVQADAVEQQKRAMKQVEEGLALNREQVKEQKNIISLLEEIRDEVKKKS